MINPISNRVKKLITLASFFALALVVLALPLVTNAAVQTVGNDNASRGTVDSASNFTIIDTNNPAVALGTITSFDYFATTTNPFRFVLVDSAFKVLWLSAQITPALGAQTYTLSGYITVHSGDNVGLYFPLTGTIPYNDGGAAATYTAAGSGLPVVNNTLVSAGTSNRTYSFVANGQTGVLPGVPTISNPANNANLTSAAYNLVDWNNVAGSFSPITYQFESYSNSAYSNLLFQSDWQATSSISTAGSAEGTYYLRVRSQDNLGNLSAWSNSSTTPFRVTISNATTTVPGLPTVPSFIFPANGATVAKSVLYKIDWTNSIASATPVTYQYEAYSDAAYTALVKQSIGLQTSEINATGTPEGTYYIRVRAKDNAGNLSAWSNGPANSYRFIVSQKKPVRPIEKDFCYKYGWKNFPNLNFKNQGQCIAYVNRYYKSQGHGKKTEFGGKNIKKQDNRGNREDKNKNLENDDDDDQDEQEVNSQSLKNQNRNQLLKSIQNKLNALLNKLMSRGKNSKN